MQVFRELQNKFQHIWFYDANHSYYNTLLDKKLISTTQLIGKFQIEQDYNKGGNANKYMISEDLLGQYWELEKNRGTTKGSLIHNYIEKALERSIMFEADNMWLPLKIRYQIHEFVKDFYFKSGLCLYKQEMVLGNELVGGKPDNLSIDENDKFVLLDYKTDKKIEYTNKYNVRLKAPFNHLYDCEFTKYCLQTSIYRILFGKDLIEKSYIIWFNENNDTYQKIECHFYEAEAQHMIKLAHGYN